MMWARYGKLVSDAVEPVGGWLVVREALKPAQGRVMPYGRPVALVETAADANLVAAAPLMLAALQAIRGEIARCAKDTLEGCTLMVLDPDGEPIADRSTLTPSSDDEASVIEIEGMLAQVDAAIAAATGEKS